MTLAEQIETIRSRRDFVAFVRALRLDLRDDPTSWENDDLPRFLEALAAWAEAMDGYYINQGKPVPQQPDWRVAASMLMAAKIYE